MSIRDDIKMMDTAMPGVWPTVVEAWNRIKAEIPLPPQTTMERFIEFPVGQKFTMDRPDTYYNFVKVGENALVRARKSDGKVEYIEDVRGDYGHWKLSPTTLKEI